MNKADAIQHLIDREYTNLVEAEFYLDFYKKEMRNPTKVGAAQAKESVDIWEKRIVTLTTHINLLKEYGRKK